MLLMTLFSSTKRICIDGSIIPWNLPFLIWKDIL